MAKGLRNGGDVNRRAGRGFLAVPPELHLPRPRNRCHGKVWLLRGVQVKLFYHDGQCPRLGWNRRKHPCPPSTVHLIGRPSSRPVTVPLSIDKHGRRSVGSRVPISGATGYGVGDDCLRFIGNESGKLQRKAIDAAASVNVNSEPAIRGLASTGLETREGHGRISKQDAGDKDDEPHSYRRCQRHERCQHHCSFRRDTHPPDSRCGDVTSQPPSDS